MNMIVRAFEIGLSAGRNTLDAVDSCPFDHRDRAVERQAWFDGFAAGRTEVRALIGEPD